MLTEYATLRSLFQRTDERGPNVIVLPESTVHHWNAAAEAFWNADLKDRRMTVILGAQIPEMGSDGVLALNRDTESSLRYLRGESWVTSPRRPRPGPYRNVIVLLGPNGTRIVDQHIPVPLAMWKPLNDGGVKIQWGPNRAIPVLDQRVCILICYEALLVWPVLSSMFDRPTLLCVLANDRWVVGTPIRKYRQEALRGWSQLFGIPFLEASNR
jgi:hypothetical protein